MALCASLNHGLGAPHAFRRDRDAGINTGLQQNLGDLLLGHALFRAPRTWTSNSCHRPIDESIARLSMLRVLRDKPSRLQTLPQQKSSVNSWNRESKMVGVCGGFTCDAPRTSLRILAPTARRSLS